MSEKDSVTIAVGSSATPVRRGSFTVALGGMTDGSAGPGFKIDGDTAEVTFFGGADPHDPAFWRKVYAIPSLATPDWTNQGYMIVKLVERLHRYGS